MNIFDLVLRAAALLGLMAALALLETLVALRPAARGARWRVNLGLTLLFLLVNVALTAGAVGVAAQLQPGLFPALGFSGTPAFIAGIVLLDACAYAAHVLMHRLPGLWRIHRVHHSDEMVDVTTAFRQHPAETLVRFLFTALPAVLLGVPPAAAAAYRMLSGINALMEHANIRVAPALDRALRWLVVTPPMHKLHHSQRQAETDSNYGNILALFDRLCGTYTPAGRENQIVYGLEQPGGDHHSLQGLLSLPWRGPASTTPAAHHAP